MRERMSTVSQPFLRAEGDRWQSLDPTACVKALEDRVQSAMTEVEALQHKAAVPTWDGLFGRIELVSQGLQDLWKPVAYLHGVKNTPALRECFERGERALLQYRTWLRQHAALYQKNRALQESPDFSSLSASQRKALQRSARLSERAGAGRPREVQARLGAIDLELTGSEARFGNHVLDATRQWSSHIQAEAALAGLPEAAKLLAQREAERQGLPGWVLTLDSHSYLTAVTYCQDRQLRQTLYQAYSTRASDQGPTGVQFDNDAVMEAILRLRAEKAQLLGFSSYAAYSVADKTAGSVTEAIEFQEKLAAQLAAQGQEEFASLQAFAEEREGISDFSPWDIAYYSQLQKASIYGLDAEELRAYFPVEKAVSGLFELLHQLFRLRVRLRADILGWDPLVQFFEVTDVSGSLVGGVYLDLFAREGKMPGAWMDECTLPSCRPDGSWDRPIAFITCNFTPPCSDQPSYLTHDELCTLFHEMGHSLQLLLTTISIPSLSGTHGVPWDAIEVPSQLLEAWCWDAEVLRACSAHRKGGQPIPQEMIEKLQRSRQFQAASFLLRQLAFGIFDIQLHAGPPPVGPLGTLKLWKQIKQRLGGFPESDSARFPNSFLHIFDGAYAAGYYSYLWAERLSADMYGRFQEEGIFNPRLGAELRQGFFGLGGVADPQQLFEAFRGRSPSWTPLLRQRGLSLA